MRDWLQKQRLVHTQAGVTLQEPLQAARLLGRVNSCLWGIFDVQASIVQQLRLVRAGPSAAVSVSLCRQPHFLHPCTAVSRHPGHDQERILQVSLSLSCMLSDVVQKESSVFELVSDLFQFVIGHQLLGYSSMLPARHSNDFIC